MNEAGSRRPSGPTLVGSGPTAPETAQLPALPGAPATTELPSAARVTGAPATAELPLAVTAPAGPPEHGPLQAGEVIAGRLRVLSLREEGGQSWIYQAENVAGPSTEPSLLALKLYKETIRPDENIVRALKALRHPSLMPILECGWHGTRYYEVMPWAEGGSLLDRIAGGNPLTPAALAELVVALAPVLRFCHENGIIHRDIKPQNLFYLDPERRRLVLADFGISSVLPQDRSLVSMHYRMSTPGFAGPEAYSGRLGQESDYYGLGVTLLYLATGVSPFAGYDEWRIMGVTVSERIPVVDSLPDNIKTLIRGLLVKERKDRWGHDQLSRWLIGETVSVPEVAASANTAPPGAKAAASGDSVGTDRAGPAALGFLFEGTSYTERTALALALGRRWDEAKKRLYRGQLREWARQFDLDLANRIQDLEEEERDQDRGVYEALSLLYPDGPFAYRGLVAANAEAVGVVMGESFSRGGDTAELALEALSKGVLGHWLRGQGKGELAEQAEALRRFLPGREDYAAWRLHFLLCPEAPLPIRDRLVRTPQDLVAVAAADWEAGSELPWRGRVLAWLAERGLTAQAEAWSQAEADYCSDKERGLAVFLVLIHPAARHDPTTLAAYHDRVAEQLDDLKREIASHVFRGDKARKLESEGQALSAEASKLGELALPETVDLQRRVRLWVNELRQADGADVPDGVVTRSGFERLTTEAREVVDAARERVEILLEGLFRRGETTLSPVLRRPWTEAPAGRDYDSCRSGLTQGVAVIEEALARLRGELRRTEAAREKAERVLFDTTGFLAAIGATVRRDGLQSERVRLLTLTNTMESTLTEIQAIAGRGRRQPNETSLDDRLRSVRVVETLLTPGRIALGFETSLVFLSKTARIVTCALKAPGGSMIYLPAKRLTGNGPVLLTVDLPRADLPGHLLALSAWNDETPDSRRYDSCLARTAWLDISTLPVLPEAEFRRRVTNLRKKWKATVGCLQ